VAKKHVAHLILMHSAVFKKKKKKKDKRRTARSLQFTGRFQTRYREPTKMHSSKMPFTLELNSPRQQSSVHRKWVLHCNASIRLLKLKQHRAYFRREARIRITTASRETIPSNSKRHIILPGSWQRRRGKFQDAQMMRSEYYKDYNWERFA
jgi:hypothetical protein